MVELALKYLARLQEKRKPTDPLSTDARIDQIFQQQTTRRAVLGWALTAAYAADIVGAAVVGKKIWDAKHSPFRSELVIPAAKIETSLSKALADPHGFVDQPIVIVADGQMRANS